MDVSTTPETSTTPSSDQHPPSKEGGEARTRKTIGYFIFPHKTSTSLTIPIGGIVSLFASLMVTDTSILHHAFISIFIALWAVITHYISILMAIFSYFTRFTMKRGNAGNWNSGWKRRNVGNLFCTTPKVLKLHGTPYNK